MTYNWLLYINSNVGGVRLVGLLCEGRVILNNNKLPSDNIAIIQSTQGNYMQAYQP